MSQVSDSFGIKQLIKSIQRMVDEAGTGKKKIAAWRDPPPNTYGLGERYWVDYDLSTIEREHLFDTAKEHIDSLRDRVFSTGPSIKRASLTLEEQEAIIRDVIVPELENHPSRWTNGIEGSAVERIAEYSETKCCSVFCDLDGDAESIIAGCLESECSGGELDSEAVEKLRLEEVYNYELANNRAAKLSLKDSIDHNSVSSEAYSAALARSLESDNKLKELRLKLYGN